MSVEQKIFSVVKKHMQEPFWENSNQPNVLKALTDFFRFYKIDIDERHMYISKTEEIESNQRKIRYYITIPDFFIYITLLTYKEHHWMFQFEKIDNKPNNKLGSNYTPIHKENIVVINGKECILYIFDSGSYGIKLYAIPIDIASELNIPHFDDEEISHNEHFLYMISEYEMPYYSSYNTD